MTIEEEIAAMCEGIAGYYGNNGDIPSIYLENLEQHIIAYFQEKDNEHRESE